MAKYRVISGSYFPAFGLNTERSVFSPNAGKYEPEITPYLDTFHAVWVICFSENFWKTSSPYLMIGTCTSYGQKQPYRGFLIKRYSENMQQICRTASMPKCDFNKVVKQLFFEITLRHGCSPVNLLHIFRTPFPTKGYFCMVG